MPSFNKGTLGRIFIGAVLGTSAITHIMSDEIGVWITGSHDGVKPLMNNNNNPTTSLAKTKEQYNFTGSKQNTDQISDATDSETAKYKKWINEEYDYLKETVLNDPEATDEDKHQSLKFFYSRLTNPKDIELVPDYGSHAAFVESMRARAKLLFDKHFKEMTKLAESPLELFHYSKQVNEYFSDTGQLIINTGTEDERIEFDSSYAEGITGMSEDKLYAYIETFYLPAAKQALQNYRREFIMAPATPEQIKENRSLAENADLTYWNFRGLLQRQNPSSNVSAENLIGLTPSEFQDIRRLTVFPEKSETKKETPANKPAAPG